MENRKGINMNTDAILQRITDLQNNLFGLENSDDRLFSNGNGNLATYTAMTEEIGNLKKMLAWKEILDWSEKHKIRFPNSQLLLAQLLESISGEITDHGTDGV